MNFSENPEIIQTCETNNVTVSTLLHHVSIMQRIHHKIPHCILYIQGDWDFIKCVLLLVKILTDEVHCVISFTVDVCVYDLEL